jgi:hypothetical protein
LITLSYIAFGGFVVVIVCFTIPEIEPKALNMLGKPSTT